MKVETPHYTSADVLYRDLISWVMNTGEEVVARGLQTRERTGAYFVLTNPRARLISSASRKWSLPLALGELCWHLRGDNFVAPLKYYTERWARYSDDGVHIRGSCYGRKIFSPSHNGSNRWQEVVALLRHDPNSRRAVLDLANEGSDLIGSKDVSCVNAIQFLVRDGCLDLFVFMRSNDLFIGLPYDMFFFTMLQEIMAVTLDRPVGHYHHIATSLHVYENDFQRASEFCKSLDDSQSAMPALMSTAGIEQFLIAEARIREGLAHDRAMLDDYWAPLADHLVGFCQGKVHKHR
ncbi:MAG: hypothetical protein EOQ48_14005 [Mesorhizobium sp.]|uniref:thymidylate synthase n=1 Tax=Mesorhizobium sp. TaxID=1871066 RepID=UPI000FE723EF|nr:MAG: hypothetical protein EOQ48_14005 [Mesorhizobium sp.]